MKEVNHTRTGLSKREATGTMYNACAQNRYLRSASEYKAWVYIENDVYEFIDVFLTYK